MTLQDYTGIIYGELITDHSSLTVPKDLDVIVEEVLGPDKCREFFRVLIERMMEEEGAEPFIDENGNIAISCSLCTVFTVFAEFCEPLIEKTAEKPKEVQDVAEA